MGSSLMLIFWGVPNVFFKNCDGPIKVTTSTKTIEEKKNNNNNLGVPPN